MGGKSSTPVPETTPFPEIDLVTAVNAREAHEKSGARGSSQAVYEMIEGQVLPDKTKEDEVLAMRQKFEHTAPPKSFPWNVLLARFKEGRGGMKDVICVLKLIVEVKDFLLTPILNAGFAPNRPRTDEKPVYIMVGITGAGKSLTGNWMLGKCVKKVKIPVKAVKRDEDDPDEDSDYEEEKTLIEVEDADLLVGQDKFKSMTFAPNVVEHDQFYLIDYPGFCDTNGFEVRIGMDLAFREMLDMVKPAHVLCLLPIKSFEVGRGQATADQLDKVKRLLPLPGCNLGAGKVASEQNSCSWMIGITKCDRDFMKNAKEEFSDAQTWLADHNFSNVVDINKVMFSKRGVKAREDFLQTLLDTTHTPVLPMECLHEDSKEAFGNDVALGCLTSDCLTVSDTTKLANVLRSTMFEALLVGESAEELVVDAEALNKKWEDAQNESFMATTVGTKGTVSWDESFKILDKELVKIKNKNRCIQADSQNLLNTGHLALESRDATIGELCAHTQPGIKLSFANSESNICMRNTAKTMELFREICVFMQVYHEKGCLRGEFVRELKEQSDRVKRSLDAAAQDVGFKNVEDLVDHQSTWAAANIGATVTSTCAMVVLFGISSWACGVGMALSLVSGAKLARDEWNMRCVKDKLKEALTEIETTVWTLLGHRKKLTKIEEKLKSLQIG